MDNWLEIDYLNWFSFQGEGQLNLKKVAAFKSESPNKGHIASVEIAAVNTVLKEMFHGSCQLAIKRSES